VTLLISAPILLLFLILNSNSIANIYLLLILKTLIPLLVAATLMFGVSDEANLKLGLYEPLLEKEQDASTEMLLNPGNLKYDNEKQAT